MTQLITKPARETTSTATTIDVILTSVPDKHMSSGVIKSVLRDHYFVYTIWVRKLKKNQPKTITCRDYKKFDEKKFKEDLANAVVCITDNHDNVDDYWAVLKSKEDEISNMHAPLKTHRMKCRKNPWITRDVIIFSYKKRLHPCQSC